MTSTPKTWHIYSLSDPRTEAVRYVGWAFDVKRRVSQHVLRARKETTHKANWLNQLAGIDMKPDVTVLESGKGDWAEAERTWIAFFLAEGADLTNATKGGEGVVGLVFSDESRAKMADAKRGRKLPREQVQRLADTLRGRPRPAEVRAAISAAKKGHAVSEETRAKLSIAMRGKRHSAEARANMSAGHKRESRSEETKQKIRLAHLGKTLTAEHRAKLSEAKMGRRLSEECKAKIKASSGGWKHTPETIAIITAARRARAARDREAKNRSAE